MIGAAGGVVAARGSDAQRVALPVAHPAANIVAASAVDGPPVRQPIVDSDTVKEAAHRINEQLRALQQGLQFSVDEATGHTVVLVLDSETGQTIRQIPSEEALAISQSLERLQGILLKQQA